MLENEVRQLVEISKEIRVQTMRQMAAIGVGHVGGCLSVTEAVVYLYCSKMRIDASDPGKKDRDRFVLSKGHAGPTLYSMLAYKGYFPEEELDTLNRSGTRLPSHCDMNRTPGVDMTAGSLGQGLSCAVGMALASKLRGDGSRVYCIIGDGEAQEGQIWEAAIAASKYCLDNLVVFMDANKYQLDGTVEEVSGITEYEEKFRSFGFYAQTVPGHDFREIDEAVTKSESQKGKPSMIVLDTIKGKGVQYVVDARSNNHNMPVSREQYEQMVKEIRSAE